MLLLAVVVSACTAPASLTRISADEKHWLLSGEALAGKASQKTAIADEDVLGLTGEMRHFADAAVSGFPENDKLKALLRALILPSGLGLQYDADAVYTASQAFRHARANCLSFTNLFVAMARYVGLRAKFNEVDVPPIWDMRHNNTLVLNKHVNAIATQRNGRRHIVDLDLEEVETQYARRKISDNLAIAQHYNNRAMQHLAAARYGDALGYLVKALSLERHVSYFWNNLGSLYRRAGNPRAAELAFRTAIEENPADLVAISNAARLYAAAGKEKLAAQYARRAHYFRMRNPYFRYGMAMKAFADGDYELARGQVEAAIQLYAKEHRFYFLLGAIQQKTGDTELAVNSFNRAMELSDDRQQRSGYRRKMDSLLSMNTPAGATHY